MIKVKITYNISGEELEELLKNEDIENVEVVTGTNDVVEKWLKEKDINGYAVSLAYKLFCGDNPSANVSIVKFSKAVKATGIYITKNLRICDSVQRCFVQLDGRKL